MKKSNYKTIMATISMLVIVLFLFSFVNKGWDVPDAFKKKENPQKDDKTSVAKGKVEYTKSCKSCHGEKGDSKVGAPANFTTKEFKAQTDGSIFYKIHTGMGKMPSFKNKDYYTRWDLVNYIKTLK